MKVWNPKVKEDRPTCPLVTPSNSRCLQNCVCLIKHDNGDHSCTFLNALQTFARAGEVSEKISKEANTMPVPVKRRGRKPKKAMEADDEG